MAAEELFKMRKDFVSSVSEEIVDQLLDGLLDDKVINNGEKDAIIKKNQTDANRARQLIDSVRNKGDDASNKLILHLKDCDFSLYKTLRQKCGLPVEPAAQESLDQRDMSASKKLKEDDFYPVTLESVKNRVALLITNINFMDEEKNRHGAQKDEETMKNLLSSYGYEVVKRTDLTAKQMDDALVEFSKHPKLKGTDSVFVVIMSHGKRGVVQGVDFSELPVDNIFTHLNTENCPELRDKPKIIIIQACRGDQPGSVWTQDNVEADSVAAGVMEKDGSFKHKENDFIPFLSSTPGTVSYRHSSEGSIMIQLIDEVFKEHACHCHILELFVKVMNRFKDDDKLRNETKQMPVIDRCSSGRLFRFSPS